MADIQTPYGFTNAHRDILSAAVVLDQQQRLKMLHELLQGTPRHELMGILSEFIGLALSVEENARGVMNCCLMAHANFSERMAEDWNFPTIAGALEGARRAIMPTPGMCDSCAFRRASVPNQCLVTQLDAQNAKENCANFMCHEGVDDNDEPTRMCVGFAIATREVRRG